MKLRPPLKLHPNADTLARIAWAAWVIVGLALLLDATSIKIFIALVALAVTVSLCAAIKYHAAVIAGQVLNADRWYVNGARGATLAHLDAVADRSGTGPFPMFNSVRR